jgi:membrane protease YdiL (CAAX protease family)
MGADLIPTLLQIAYATSIGYLFVTIFYKSKSLVPCIITHSIMNALSVFSVELGVHPINIEIQTITHKPTIHFFIFLTPTPDLIITNQ